MPPEMRHPEERFWEKVNKSGPIPAERPDLGPCWIWEGSLQRNGYGVFTVRRQKFRAHRFAYALTAELVEGLQIDHLCRTRACVRADHLEQVTARVNTMRGTSVAVHNAARTHCPQRHPYSGDNLYVTPEGVRQCRICKRAHACGSRLNASVLTPTLRTLLDLMASDATRRDMADHLGVTVGAIAANTNRLYRVLGVRDRPSAIAAAKQRCLLSEP